MRVSLAVVPVSIPRRARFPLPPAGAPGLMGVQDFYFSSTPSFTAPERETHWRLHPSDVKSRP